MLMRECCRSKMSPALTAVMVAVLSASAASASVISGPTLSTGDSGYSVSGLGFVATVSTTLTSFTFQNQGLADTVDLVDPLGNILHSASIPSGTPSDTVSVSWSLTGGNTYYLLQTTQSNALFTAWGLAAPSDAQIALNVTSIFTCINPPTCTPTSLISADFSGGASDQYWADFNNITTTGSSVPEPASFGLVLLAGGAILWRARGKALIP